MARGTIILRKTKDGGRRYETRIRLDGRQNSRTFQRKIDAEAWLDKMSAETRDGSYRELKPATFGQYVETWRTIHLIPARLKPNTINGYASNLERHILPAFAPRSIASIDSANVSAFESRLLRDGNAAKSVRNIMELLNRIFGDAVRDGYLRHNPMNGSKLAPVPKHEARALTADEARALLDECSGDLNLVVMLGLLAGLRRAEIFALRWTDVDFDGNSLRVSRAVFWRHGRYQSIPDGEPAFTFTPPKSKTSIRTVDLSPELKRQLLQAYMESADKDGLIFQTSAGTPHDPANVYRRMFKPTAERAGLSRVGLHTLRHTFGSWKIRQGEDVVYVSRQLGHANVSITANVYAHLIDARRPEAAAKTDAYLFGTSR